ncbi:RagB/SusD family nutrient uptake outer membrane protein [Sinomicrobium weinanense]|uniref:RagB/SusD family nutrient uptake outer membrane protein n=1 Tax=Sinomicrobium weinanense TaxID=2842200 RepID=A0A926Q5D0_9FLAO|nr:RagB/SusD family nutrient uptake outer membrane protein [Sinomicrobium weinanense]MBC9798026.1 RagB/SusD family nutrient uptake outer membrane protein [Sinomicrobium weinanense]MBU3125863.1 RagB/SusD family nutrient uptake outer membrane protein [Sinomicrobium weinanense]
MKKKNIYFTAIFLAAFMWTGCSDFLEVEPKSSWKAESFYSTREEADLALSGIYSELANDDVYGWKFNVLLEAGTDESYTNDPNNPTWDDAKYAHTPSSDAIKNIWLRFYTCIQLVNQFEKNLNPDLFTAEAYNNLLAKARFMRAFCYYNLAGWFGPVPLRLTPSYSQEDNNVPASPLIDVYTQVESDYLFAAEHLKHANSSEYVPGEPNKMAAHGLLARLYLRMGGFQPYLSGSEAGSYFENNQQYFEKAREQCEIIINDGWHGIVPYAVDSMSYRNHFLSYLQDRYDLRESLFEISFGNFQSMGLTVDGRLGNINGVEFVGTQDIPRGFCKVNVGLPVYHIYSQEDTRREWNIAGYRNKYSSANRAYTMSYIFDYPLNQEYGIGKFRRWEPSNLNALKEEEKITDAGYTILNNTPGSDTDPNFTSINFPVLRYSDVLLMHAEAVIGGRFGTAAANDAALNDLNTVRERVGLEPYTGSLNHDDFFKEIVDERLRELCFEGLRKQDLIRWDLLEEKLMETNETISNHALFNSTNQFHQTYLSPGNNFDRARHLLLPYPLQETLINQSLEQRTGW